MTTTLHPAARLRRSGDGNIALGQMAHTICDEHDRIAREIGPQNADMWLEALCGLLGGMVEPVRRDGPDTAGCPTCDTVLDTLAECHGMSLRGTTAAEVAASARDWIGDLVRERDEARAEVERLRAEVASLRGVDNDCDAAPDTGEPDDGWEPGPWWTHYTNGGASAGGAWEPGAQVHRAWPSVWVGVVWIDPRQPGRRSDAFDDPRSAMRWCEQQPEMADVIAGYTSAPTVGATDAGPDAPALIVEGDDGTGAREARAVPAAPVSGAEQSCGETGVDRPHKNVDRAAADLIRALGWMPIIKNDGDEESFEACAVCGEQRTPWRHEATQVARDVLLIVVGGPGDDIAQIRSIVEQMSADQRDASERATAEFARVAEAVSNAGIEFADFYHEPHLVIDELAAQLNRAEHELDEARTNEGVLRDERSAAATILAKACFRDYADDTLLGHARHAVEVIEEMGRQHREVEQRYHDVRRECEYATTELADMAGRVVAPDDITNLIAAVEAVRDELSYRSGPDTVSVVFDSNGCRLKVGDLVMAPADGSDSIGLPGDDAIWRVTSVDAAEGSVTLRWGLFSYVKSASACTLCSKDAPLAPEATDGEG